MMILRRWALPVMLLLSGTLAWADTHHILYESYLKDLWEHRSDARGVVALYMADSLLDSLDSQAPLEEALQRVLSAQDADPELQAHAAAKLSQLYRDEGKTDNAAKLDASLGFVDQWRILGPFDDENKQGFDMPYPPEIELTYEATYKGKTHPVSWRVAPSGLQQGLVPLDQFLDPSEKVAGYALVFIKAPADSPCVLRGGYNEAYKLWVDGEAVASRKRYNGRAFDQFADACTLRKGWNILLVKVCNQEAGWNFAVRVTDAAGRALRGLVFSSDPKDVDEAKSAILAKDGRPPEGYKVQDPVAQLTAAAGEGASADTLEACGLLVTVLRSYDRTDDSNLKVLRRAAEAQGSAPSCWVALGDAEVDHNRKRADYQAALEKAPQDVIALERMARYYLSRGMPFPALEYIRAARKADGEDFDLRALEDKVRLQYITDGLALADVKEAYAAHPGCDAFLEVYQEATRALGQSDESDRLTEAYRLANQSEAGVWFNRISDLARSGRSEQAISLLDDMEKRFPLDRTVRFRHAGFLLALKQPEEAEKVLGPALLWSPDWPEGHDLMGDLELALGRTKEALAQYQVALTLKPQMEAIKRKVTYLSPKEEGFEVAYRVDPKEVPAELGEFASQPAVVLLDNTVVKVQPSGLSSRYTQLVIQVIQAGIAQQLQYYPISFDPDREEVRVLEASILKADGRKVHAEVMVTDALQDPQYRLYYRNRNMVLSFPSLSAGDKLWIEYKVSEVGEESDYGKYFGSLMPFAGRSPIVLKQFTLIAPESLQLVVHEDKTQSPAIVLTKGGERIYRWVARRVERVQSEPEMPGLTELVPYVHVSTFADSDAMGAWYAKFIEDQWEMTPDVKAKVAELTEGLSTQEEKVRSIHRWVVQQTHYVGLEFGVHGYRPYKVRQIFERRFGDCKDKALLMAAMLRQAGFDAGMVMVRTRDNGEIFATPSSLAVFNHVICYVPELDLFLDGTAEYTGLRELPYQDQGMWVQIVWPDGRTKRVKTPVDKPDANTYEARYEIELGTGGDLTFKAQVAITGQECGWIRHRYQDPGNQREVMEKDLSNNYPGTRLDSVELSDLAGLSMPITATFGGVLGQAARPDGKDRVSLPAWLGRLSLQYALATMQDRTLPLEIDYPWRQTYVVTYRLPEGAQAAVPPPVELDGTFGSVKRTVKQEGGLLTASTTVELKVTRVEVGDYAAFKSFCQVAERATEDRIRVQLPGGRP